MKAGASRRDYGGLLFVLPGAVGPDAPVDRDSARSRGVGRLLLGEHVEERVRRAVVDLADLAEERGLRREEREELERVALQELAQEQGPVELRAQHGERLRRRLQLREPRPRDAREVERAVDGTEGAAYLGERGVWVWHGNYYALELSTALGREPDGMVRVGLLHYNTDEEIDRLLSLLAELGA